MTSSVDSLAALSYGIGLAGFVAFGGQLVWRWRGGLAASLVLGAVAASAVWELCGFLLAMWPTDSTWRACQFADAARLAIWFAFLRTLGREAQSGSRGAKAFLTSGAGVGVASLTVLILALAWFPLPPFPGSGLVATGYSESFALMLAAAIVGLALAEQLFRNTPASARWSIKPVCLGLAAVFAFDLFVFSDALMLRHLDHDLWRARGITHALAIPFIALSAVRNRDWTIEIHVSRQLMFHSTAVLASGIYLLAVAAAGYYVRLFGGDWGKTIQAIFLFTSLLLLAWLFFSGTVRAKLRVLVNKHFFSYRYDYREEWLRFTRLLSTPDPHLGLQVRCVKALADLVESPGGGMWVRRTRGFVQTSRWNFPEIREVEPSDGALARFLERSGWVINIPELSAQPGRYADLPAPALLEQLRAVWLIVPLFSGDELLGFVALAAPRTQVKVDWEVRDLLKAAAHQVGTFVAQLETDEALLETKKFDAFNRMSAFVVHDLKNLVAQLSLMLNNAERHRDNPEFQADMLETVGHVTSRMNNLLLQLRSGTTPVSKPGLVDLGPVARRIVNAKTAQGRALGLEVGHDVFALGHEDRIERVVGHLVQNALDATPESGQVTLRIYPDGDNTVIEVWDTGQGMSPEFVRNNLFKPFQTTKTTGMGIGFYESAQYIQELGGNINVDSKLGAGTRVTVVIPRHSGATMQTSQTKAAA